MPGNIHFTAADVTRRRPQGHIGDIVELALSNDYDMVVNDSPQTQQVGTIVVDTATNSATYAWTLNGVAMTYVADSSTSDSEVATGIAAAINAEPLVRGQVSASAASATVTVTSLYPGLAFTLSDTDAKITSTEATTANDEADAVPFGRLVVSTTYQTDEANRRGGLAKSTAFSAQVDTYAVTYDAGVLINVAIDIEGETYSASHLMATDLDTSLDAIAALLNTALPANSVAVTATPSTATSLVLTSELAGKPFTSRMWFGTGADTGAFTKTSTASISTDVTRAAVGVSVRDLDVEAATVGESDPEYPANAGVRALKRGKIWVECAQTVTPGQPVYVELDGTGANAGRFYNTTASTRALLPQARWVRDERSTPGDLSIAVLSIALD